MADELDLTDRRILIVDDMPANLDVLVQALQGERYNIFVAADGESAIEVAANSEPDLILLDVMMPGIDGYETCRRLKRDERLAHIPVLFLTARDDLPGIVEGFESGGLDYMTKPFRKKEVLSRIRTHLERSILMRNLAEAVEVRTRELNLKVRELEGRDRINEHMLTVHTVEETLALVLEVICDVLDVDRALVYLKADDNLRPAAAIGWPDDQLNQRASNMLESPQRAAILAQVEEQLIPAVATNGHDYLLAPIARRGHMLGLIEVQSRGQRAVVDSDLRTLNSLALQAAVAIKDAQARLDPAEWQDELDEAIELDQDIDR